jgi:hypothetical protein
MVQERSHEHQTPSSMYFSEVTQLLRVWREGDRKALGALLPLIYKELRRVAHFQPLNERPNHTLQSAGLVNEAITKALVFMGPSSFVFAGASKVTCLFAWFA